MSLQIIMMFQWGLTLLITDETGVRSYFWDHEAEELIYLKVFLKKNNQYKRSYFTPIISGLLWYWTIGNIDF
jgi:hypothetical protein